MKLIRNIYLSLLIFLSIFISYELIYQKRLQTDITALLPIDSSINQVWRTAEAINNQYINHQILLLVGFSDANQAFAQAEQIASQWQKSHLFKQIQSSIYPDINQIDHDMNTMGIALLPTEQAQYLITQPNEYFAKRAADAINPFSGSLLPLDKDWLGISRFLSLKHNTTQLNWNTVHGMLYTEQNAKTWVLIHAETPSKFNQDQALLTLLHQTQQNVQQQGGELLATGGQLFSSYSKVQAEQDSTKLSIIGILLTFTLLISIFRHYAILSILIPIISGLITGLASCIFLIGEIHILTIVIGTSLIGMLVDFPLHWLAAALFQPQWKAQTSIIYARKIFSISLMISIAGYLLLLFTPLVILQQTAIFSAAALIGAFVATLCFMPYFFHNYQYRPNLFTLCCQRILNITGKKTWQLGLMVLFTGCALGSIWSQWQDDIRDWSNIPSTLLTQSQKIGQITGQNLTGQYVLIKAKDNDELLNLSLFTSNLLQQQGAHAIQSIHQWILPITEQSLIKQQLKKIAHQPSDYASLTTLGIPNTAIKQALLNISNQENISIQQSLNNQIADTYRHLYLGQVDQYHIATIRFSSSHSPSLPSHPNIMLMDTRQHLNTLFEQTRSYALILKLISLAIAWLVLIRLFNLRQSMIIISLPILALTNTIGILGWLNIPISLFSTFGMLLTAAIGIDYAIYTHHSYEPYSTRIGGLTLAAATTSLSFGLLCFSSTPAIVVFGLSVTIGTLSCWLTAITLIHFTHPSSQLSSFRK